MAISTNTFVHALLQSIRVQWQCISTQHIRLSFSPASNFTEMKPTLSLICLWLPCHIEIYLVSPWYGWKKKELALNNNPSLTHATHHKLFTILTCTETPHVQSPNLPQMFLYGSWRSVCTFGVIQNPRCLASDLPRYCFTFLPDLLEIFL